MWCPSPPRVSGSSFVVLEDALALLIADPGPLMGAIAGLLFRDDKSNRRQIKTEMSYKVSSGSPSLSSIDRQRNSSKAPGKPCTFKRSNLPKGTVSAYETCQGLRRKAPTTLDSSYPAHLLDRLGV
ncbi:hypothetical protein EV421DRAFT_1739169 [Armillaria borealis]|uniref:Uncharacterized protein n=1 Tax=Armillaria borealis TaxID=47425 RepID=A0AA39J9C6_9AGAR|nr:hypothetical protein EV421DRAFT_1739169 [Armillaria borealis]